jgi:outer membrane protein assembly factor BamB
MTRLWTRRALLTGLGGAGLCLLGAPRVGAQERLTRLERRATLMQHPMLLADARHTGCSRQQAPREGRAVWRRQLSGPVIASPAADARGLSWWATQSGQLHVLDPQGGQVLRRALPGPSHSSPALLRDGAALLATRDGEVWLLGPDGRWRWRQALGREILSSPALDEAGGRAYLSAGDETVALSLADGRVLFRVSAGNGANNSSPALGPDGLVRVVNWQGLALAISGGGVEVWRVQLAVQDGFMTSPTLGPDGSLYASGGLGILFALGADGRLRWTRALDQPVDAFLGQLPDGRVLVPGQRALVAVHTHGVESWRCDLQGERATSSPAISSDGVVFVGTGEGRIWAISARGEPLWRFHLGERVQAAPILIHTATAQPRLLIADLGGAVACLR